MSQAPDQITPLSPKRMGPLHSGRQTSFILPNINSMNAMPSASRAFSPPPTPRSPMLRQDRLSLRLKSNSGMTLHTNENALSQYTDYNCYGRSSGAFEVSSPGLPSPPTDRFAQSTRCASPFSRDGPGNLSGFTSCLPFLDFVGRDVFQMALDSPAVMRQLLHYCEKQGCEENVEFLIKIRQYAQATNEMTVVLTSISTQYTALGATKPVMFPSTVSRTLNSDIKRIAHSTIPGLEAVFTDARAHIENRLATDVFPGFVKNQLVQCTVTALETGMAGASSSQLEYPGLGTSFCMTDAMGAENPILCVSDHFVSLTGHTRADIVGQNCSLLQGPFTDVEAMRRMRVAVREGRETVELVLNFRKNGEAFWNLLFLLPLKDLQRGQIQYWLGAQVNVSENVDSRKDLLRALNAGAPLGGDPIETSSSSDRASTENAAPPTTQQGGERGRRNSSVRNSSTGQKSRRLFDSFRRRAASTRAASAPPIPLVDPSEPMPGQQKMTKNSRFAAQRFQPRAQVHVYPTAYSHYMVLRYVASDPIPSPGVNGSIGPLPGSMGPCSSASPFGSSTSSSSGSSSTSGSAPSQGGGKNAKKHSLKLPVAYYNEAAVDLLSIRADPTGADIFHVLADKAHSPTVTRSFKSTVRERLADGRSTTMKIVLDRGSGGRPGLLSKRRRSSTAAAVAARTSTSTSPRQSMQQLADPPRSSESSEAMMAAAAATAADKKSQGAAGKAPRNENLYSHWVPLKNAMGVTEWVVLLLTPIPNS
ncbi:hypothetical protein PG996_009985 [Apiospora saccharicola]|uniref:RGS domain-containing protein n=1 Tax=Apiospora saccharicola TaxID=335842 RepID=A0ABR1UMA8_9PEZI